MSKRDKRVATFSIDWEDFGQLYYRNYFGGSLVEPDIQSLSRQTQRLLKIFDEAGVQSTFFVVACLARQAPSLVRDIHSSGHEVALHSLNHQFLYRQTPELFEENTRKSKSIVEDIVQQPVVGYRAPYFSIVSTNIEYLSILSRLGFLYDSSIFPVKMSRYGINGFPMESCNYLLPCSASIVELPIYVHTCAGFKWPVGGGGYWRLMPWPLIKAMFSNLPQNLVPNVYMHPYEFDTRELDVSKLFSEEQRDLHSMRIKIDNFRWNLNRGSIARKTRRFLGSSMVSRCDQEAKRLMLQSPRVLPQALG